MDMPEPPKPDEKGQGQLIEELEETIPNTTELVIGITKGQDGITTVFKKTKVENMEEHDLKTVKKFLNCVKKQVKQKLDEK